MKIWSSEHIFNHSWENVVKAALQKYPNPLTPGVIGVDVIDRTILDNGIIKSHRLLMTQWSIAPWIAKLIGGNRTCYASEHSQIDRENKTFSLRSRNLTFNNVINVDEKLVYTTHPDDSEKTMLKQEAIITVQNVPLIDYLENLFMNKMNTNAHTGRQAIEFIIHKMNNITEDMNNNLTNATQTIYNYKN
jgi:hypothetical protein